jgi:ATP-dependent DNA helicase RecQ
LLGLLKELAHAGALEENFVTRVISQRECTYAEYSITEKGRDLMNRRIDDFQMKFPDLGGRKSRKKTTTPNPQDVPTGLLDILRERRNKLARQYDVPAYVVAPNKTLEDLAFQRPMSKEALGLVHGMGKNRIQKYGRPFLEIIRGWKG